MHQIVGIKLLRSMAVLVFILFFVPILKAENCTINAGIDQNICPAAILTLNGTAAGLLVGETTWTQVSGPAVVITTPNALSTTVTGYTGGNTYKFWLSTNCDDGTLIHDEVIITIKSITTANAGTDQTLCTNPLSPYYAGNLSANAVGTGETGAWSRIGADNGVTVITTSSPISNIKLDSTKTGITVERWTITKAGCTSYDEVNITNRGGASTVNAGPDQLLECYSSTATATMAASYSGTAGGQSGLWTTVKGPNNPAITNTSSRTTTVTNLIQGSYLFRWTVAGPCINGNDTIRITVPAPGQSLTSLGATTAQIFCDSRTNAILSSTTPTYASETVTWSLVSALPAPASLPTIVSPHNPSTQVTGLNGVSGTLYTFSYTISNSYGCSRSVNHTIQFIAAPTSVTVTDKLLTCDVTSSSITPVVTPAGSGNRYQWRIVSGPSGTPYGTFPNTYTVTSSASFTIINLTSNGVYVVEVIREVNGATSNCPPASCRFNITVSLSASGSTSGTKQVLACHVTLTALAGNNPVAGTGTGTWYQLSGPNNAVFANRNYNLSAISALIPGTYVFRWLISNGVNCTPSQDDVNVIVSSTVPTAAAAGPDQTVCYATPVKLAGSIPILNETGTWTCSPSSGVVFSNINSPTSTVNLPSASTVYTLTWTIANGCGSSNDQVLITTGANPGPIQALAGTDQCLNNGTSITLAGNSPSPGTGLWSKLSGGNATITTAANPGSTVTGMTTGSYQFVWTISYNSCTVSKDTVMVNIGNVVTTPNAGTDQNVCGTSVILAGNTPATGTGNWSLVSGPLGYTITAPASPTSTITSLSDGVYTFRWTIGNGNATCQKTDDVKLYVSTSVPTTALAGADQSLCGAANTAILAGNIAATGTGLWTVISGPGLLTITTPSSPTSSVSGFVQGTYILRWTITAGQFCPPSFDEMQIAYAPLASAGLSLSFCNVAEVQLSGNAGSTGTWSQEGSTPNTATLTVTGSPTAIASGLTSGVYTFRYTIPLTGGCASTSDTMTVTNSGAGTLAEAGPDQPTCKPAGSYTVTLTGNTPTTGTGLWTKLSGPAGGTTFLPFNYTSGAKVSLSNTGIYIYEWTISNGTCSTRDQVQIIVENNTGNTINAGAGSNICGTSATLTATSVSLPRTSVWSQDSGPNTAVFSSSVSPATTVSNLIPGTYTFRWTVAGGVCSPTSGWDTLSVKVYAAATLPDAGPDQEICAAGNTTMLGNTITTGTGTWSKISGPSVSITSPNSPTTNITLSGGTGIYTFQWTSTNGSCSSGDQVVVTNYAAPTAANAGSDQSLCQYEPLILTGNTPATGTGSWAFVSGPTNPTILSPLSQTTEVLGTDIGTYIFRYSINNGNAACTPSIDDVQVVIHQLPTTATAGPNQQIDCMATPTGILSGNIPVIGTGTWTQSSGPNTASIANIHLYNSSISGLVPGTYVFRWEIANGTCVSGDNMEFVNDAKTTNLSITKSDASATYASGSSIEYTIAVGNAGPDMSIGAVVTDLAPLGTSITGWTALFTGGATGTTSGTGNISQTINIPGGGTATYQVTLAIPCIFSGNLVNTATVTANACDYDPNISNNTATDTDTDANGATTSVWNGSVSDNWNNALNWTPHTLPGLSPAVIASIPAGMPHSPVIYDKGMGASKLIIANGANLTINPGKELTVSGCSEINGPCALTLKSDESNGNASFVNIQSNSITYPNNGSACVDVFLKSCQTGVGCWHYVSSPVTGTTVGQVFEGDYVQYFDELMGQWSYISNGQTPVLPEQGFITNHPVDGARTFSGQLNDGTITRALTRTAGKGSGWNLVGNPYPCEIDLDTPLSWTNVDQVVYYYDQQAGNYKVYPSTLKFGTGSRYIPSMQGFFVHVNAAFTTGNITFTNVNKTTTGDVNFYKSDPADVLRLKVQGEGTMNDQAIVYFRQDVSSGFDKDLDCIRFTGAAEAPQLYTVATDNSKLTINGMPYNENATVVPLDFNVGTNGTGNYTLTASGIASFRPGSAIMLEDVKTKATQNLMLQPVYTFNFTDGDEPARFLLHFTTPTFGINEQQPGKEMQIYAVGREIYLKDLTNAPSDGELFIYNMLGQQLAHEAVAPINLNIFSFGIPTGYYIVRVITKDKTINSKIYIN